MRTKSFFSGLSRLFFLNLLIKPAWIFLIDRQVQNAVGSQAYGIYFALFNLTYVFLFIADAGLTNLLTQSIAAGSALNFRQLVRTKLSLLLLYAAVCFFVGWITGIREWATFLYLVLIQGLSSLFLFFRGLLTANQFFKTDALFSVLDKSLMLMLCIGPVYGFFNRMSIPLFLQLQVLATIISVTVVFSICLRKGLLFTSSQKQSTVSLAKATQPFLIIVLLMAMHYRLDGFLLERLHKDGPRQAGIYAAAYRLLDAGNMLGYLSASFLVPFIAKNQQSKITVQSTVLLLRHGLLMVAAIVASFALVFAPWIQQVLYHTNNAYNSKVIVLCISVLPAYYLTHVYGSLLTAVGAFRLFISILLLSVGTNVVINATLIPSFGAQGCCIAALVSQYACALLLFLFASKKLSLRPATQWFGFYVAIGLASWILFSLVKNLGKPVWIILAAACLVIALFALTQMARLKRFIAVLNS
jgi:O-antigen/teichoic acid export membrane protein